MTKSIDLIPTWFWPEGIPRYMSLPLTSVYASTVARWARRKPDNLAVEGNGALTYAELDQLVITATGNLRQLVNRHASRNEPASARVGLVVDRDVESMVMVLAASASGVDALILNRSLPNAVLVSRLAAFKCDLAIAGDMVPTGPWHTTTVADCLRASTISDTLPERPGQGRVALDWDGSFVLQPSATLLGWALAFRAFTALEASDTMVSTHWLDRWEGLVSLLSPLAAGAPYLLTDDLYRTEDPELSTAGAWVNWGEAVDLAANRVSGRPLRKLDWLYVSVDFPVSARTRRRMERALGTQLLTIFGTPATGPVAASPREWLIEAAVGIPFTGADLLPLDEEQRPAEPPWHILTEARVGAKSTLLGAGFAVEGEARSRVLQDLVIDTAAYGRMDANGFLFLV